MYAQKREDFHRDRMHALEKVRAADEAKYRAQSLDLAEQSLEDRKDAEKRARRLGYANIGLGAGLGLAGLAQNSGWFEPDVASEP